MKKIVFILVAIFVVLFLSSLILSAPLQKTIIPANAKWFFHFDMEKYSSSRFNDLLMKDKTFSVVEKKNAQFLEKYKIDLLKDITGITIYGIGKNKKNAVVVCAGNFDQDIRRQ